MEWTYQPVEPAQPPLVEPAMAESRSGGQPAGIRRAVLTAVVSGLLLVGGGVAAVSAASPAPSSAPSTTAPSGGSGTPRTHTGSSVNCPNMGGSSSSGSSGGSSTTPSTAPSTTPAT
jgi:hypothetical protein